MIRVILFDNDGVVSNPPEFFSDWYCREYGLPAGLMEPFFRGPFVDCIRGKADLKELLVPLLPAWKWNGGVEEFLDLWFEKENIIDEEVVALIKELSDEDIICCMATNQEKYRLAYLRKRFEGIFDEVYGSADIGFKKNQPEFAKFVANDLSQRFEIAADEILLIDDEARNVEVSSQVINAYQFTTLEALKKKLDEI
jgi:putative hydrolase of the HAD superfamily